MSSNFSHLNKTLRYLEEKYQRRSGEVLLLAVSKQQPIEKIIRLAKCGQCAFGENYVREAIEKIQSISMPELEWHFIGALQSNKLKLIAEHFHWVQTLASKKHAEKLNQYAQTLNVCIQVNISGELQKGGVSLAEVDALAHYINTLPHLQLRGVMAIGAKYDDLSHQRAQFSVLKTQFQQLQAAYPTVDTLSLGMSGDLEAAIAEGSTMVRVGTALFGAR